MAHPSHAHRFDQNPASWENYFDPDVVQVQPVTPYRSCGASKINVAKGASSQRALTHTQPYEHTLPPSLPGHTSVLPPPGQCEFVGIPALMRNSASMVVALGALTLHGLHHDHAPT